MNGEIICSNVNYKNKKITLVRKFINELHKINWCDSPEELYEKHHVKLDPDLDNEEFIITFYDNPNSLGISLYNMLLNIITSSSERLDLISIGITPIVNEDLLILEIPIGTRSISISVSYELMQIL